MTFPRRSLLAVLSFVVAGLAAWLLGGDVAPSVVVGILVAMPVFIAIGLRDQPGSRS